MNLKLVDQKSLFTPKSQRHPKCVQIPMSAVGIIFTILYS